MLTNGGKQTTPDIGKTLTDIGLPFLGSLLAGPLGIIPGAFGLISKIFGVPSEPTQDNVQAVEEKLTSLDSDTLVKLKTLEFQLQMEFIRSRTQGFEIDAADRSDARHTEVQLAPIDPRRGEFMNTLALSVCTFFGFLVLAVMLLVVLPITSESRTELITIANVLLGTVAAGFTTVVAYFFGSSAGSSSKNDTINSQLLEMQRLSERAIDSAAAQTTVTTTRTPSATTITTTGEMGTDSQPPSGPPAPAEVSTPFSTRSEAAIPDALLSAPALPVAPDPPSGRFKLTDAALKLLLDFEVGGGEAFYNTRLVHPIWPGAESGVTVGVGYDLGHCSVDQFRSDWGNVLSRGDFERLAACLGLRSTRAKPALAKVQSISIPWRVAFAVFVNSSVPAAWKSTTAAFAGIERLPGDLQGALLSLVYNRGALIDSSDRRREMRDIREAIARNDLGRIPGLLRSMIRLWRGTDIAEGMRRRREAEARLVEIALDQSARPVAGSTTVAPPAVPLTRILKRGVVGEDVRELQRCLATRGFDPGTPDGEFGPDTETAVRRFQTIAALTVDGEVGPLTWGALAGPVAEDLAATQAASLQQRQKLVGIARSEAARNLVWNGIQSEAEKYLRPLRAPLNIPNSTTHYNWCAAFVTYCCRQGGYAIPDRPGDFWATMAKVEAWKHWAKMNGTWHPRGTVEPAPGDIACFEWKDRDTELDHIGIVLAHTPGNAHIETAEGNTNNRTAIQQRNTASVVGFIRL
ncbi:MAG: peptidoglycan-binding protein [Gemmatimonadaceae bacterium]|nr:peptidoglycan-binding protein [Gloeobacterales cyanobacterium ES-bin-141]